MKNNKINYLSCLLLSSFIISCADSLDADKYFKDRMTLEEVFTDETYTERWLVDAYSYLKGENMDVASKDAILFNFADDIYFGDDLTLYSKFKKGTYNENFRHSWTNSYKGIRQASIFIQNIDMNTDLTEEERADFKAQARFVRAYYYWLLLRRYGPIPLLPDEGLDYTESYEDLARPRNTYDECADYIAKEMELAAKDLPLKRGSNQIARPTRGAALAARAKVLLYAASPINNPRVDDTEKFSDMTTFDGKHLLAQEYDEKKWARAAAAALDVIELGVYKLHVEPVNPIGSDGYPKTVTPYQDGDFSTKNWPDGYADIDPYESYRSIFNGDVLAADNEELIFSRVQNKTANADLVEMVRNQLPTFGGGTNTYGMTQKQCDAYYMSDGTDCPGKERELAIPGRSDMRERVSGFVTAQEAGTEGSGYEHLSEGVSKQYAGREPRFYASVAYNGTVWPLLYNNNFAGVEPTMRQAFYYRGEVNGHSNSIYWLRTGIGIMKYVHSDDTAAQESTNKIHPKAEPAIRYAEMLLIYAEAINELDQAHEISSWDGSKTYNLSRSIDELKRGIRPIRCRAGIPDYTDDEYQNKDLFRIKLKRERQIELMGEGHRYYDLRRWKDAAFEESLPVYGCNVLMTVSERELFHTPIVIDDLASTFVRKMYFWPIPHSELKRNSLLTQNPGWTYND